MTLTVEFLSDFHEHYNLRILEDLKVGLQSSAYQYLLISRNILTPNNVFTIWLIFIQRRKIIQIITHGSVRILFPEKVGK